MKEQGEKEKASVINIETAMEKSIKVDLKVVSDRVSESFASVLRNGREKQKLSRQDVAKALYISESLVECIEEQRLDKLPIDTYTKGYIRSYAALLGLNPEGLVRDFKQAKELSELTERDRLLKQQAFHKDAIQQQSPAFDKKVFELSDKFLALKDKFRKQFILIFISCFLCAFIFISLVNKPEIFESQAIDKVKVLSADGNIVVSDLAQKPKSTPMIQSTDLLNQEVLLTNNQKLKVAFSDTSWITVRNDKQEVIHQSRKLKGESLELSLESNAYIQLSQASAASLSLNDETIDFSESLSDDGQLHNFLIDLKK